MVFWNLYEKGLVREIRNPEKRTLKFKLNIPHYKVGEHTGNKEPEGSSLHDFEKIVLEQKRIGAENLYQLTV